MLEFPFLQKRSPNIGKRMEYGVTISYGCKGGNVWVNSPKVTKGSLSSTGLSFFVVGYTKEKRIIADARVVTKSCPKGWRGIRMNITVVISWQERDSVGFNPGFWKFSVNKGWSIEEEWSTFRQVVEVIGKDCCKPKGSGTPGLPPPPGGSGVPGDPPTIRRSKCGGGQKSPPGYDFNLGDSIRKKRKK